MTFDLGAVRADTPAASSIRHFNNAGSSLPPTPVVAACIDYTRREAEIGGYETAAERVDDLDRVYVEGARLLNAQPSELAFCTSSAQAWWRSFEAVPLEAGDKVLTSTTEYQANAFGLIQAQQRGIDVEVIPATDSGEIDLDAFTDLLDDRVRAVAITWIGLSNGMVQPAAAIGELLAGHPATYVLDACQAVGQMPVDVNELQCDLLSFTGRKFMRGPRGTAMLWARRSLIDEFAAPSYIDGRSALWTGDRTYELAPDALRWELGEVNFAAKAGFGVALAYANEIGLDAIAQRNTILADDLRAKLELIGRVTVLDQGEHKCAIVTFNVDGLEAAAVTRQLREHDINTSALMAATGLFDMEPRGIASAVRASVHYFLEDGDIDALVDAVAQIANS